MAGSERFAPLRRSGRALVALLLGVLLTVGYCNSKQKRTNKDCLNEFFHDTRI